MNLPVASLIGGLLSLPIKAAAKVALAAVSSWIVDGAQAMLAEVIKVISLVSTPSLTASWFSSSYWHIAALAMLLTVPFLFAAAVQAIIRTDLGVLLRAAFIDLPIAVLAVTLTAPLIELLLAATDEMCAVVTGGGTAGGSFLSAAAANLTNVPNGFMLLVIALVMLLAGMALMVELIMRAAAIYVVVLFLPLGFAAMVWPARRMWVKRMVEMLIALILSKFAMVAILSLAVSGLSSFAVGTSSLTTAFTAMALMVLAAFSPWALLRLLPFTELAAGAGSMLRQEHRQGVERGAGMGFNAAALATEPMAAGANALDHLVRNSATNPGGERGGLAMLSGASQRAGRQTGDGGAVQPGTDGHSDDGAGASPPGEAMPAGAAGGGAVRTGAAEGGSGGGAEFTGATSGGAVPGGAAGGAAEPDGRATGGAEPTAGAPSSPNPGATPEGPAPAKGPVGDLSPILHPDNERMELNLRGDGSDWLLFSDHEGDGRHDTSGQDAQPEGGSDGGGV